MASHILLYGLLALFFTAALASDPSPLQDFCVADTNSQGTKWALNMYNFTENFTLSRLNVKTIPSRLVAALPVGKYFHMPLSHTLTHNIHNCTCNVYILNRLKHVKLMCTYDVVKYVVWELPYPFLICNIILGGSAPEWFGLCLFTLFFFTYL